MVSEDRMFYEYFKKFSFEFLALVCKCNRNKTLLNNAQKKETFLRLFSLFQSILSQQVVLNLISGELRCMHKSRDYRNKFLKQLLDIFLEGLPTLAMTENLCVHSSNS